MSATSHPRECIPKQLLGSLCAKLQLLLQREGFSRIPPARGFQLSCPRWPNPPSVPVCPPGRAGSKLRAWHQYGIPGSRAPAWAHPSSRCSLHLALLSLLPRGTRVSPRALRVPPRAGTAAAVSFPTLSSPGTKCKSVAVPASIKNFKNRTKQTEKGFPSSFANTLIHSPKSQRTPGHLLVGRIPLRPTRTLAGEATSDPVQILPWPHTCPWRVRSGPWNAGTPRSPGHSLALAGDMPQPRDRKSVV